MDYRNYFKYISIIAIVLASVSGVAWAEVHEKYLADICSWNYIPGPEKSFTFHFDGLSCEDLDYTAIENVITAAINIWNSAGANISIEIGTYAQEPSTRNNVCEIWWEPGFYPEDPRQLARFVPYEIGPLGSGPYRILETDIILYDGYNWVVSSTPNWVELYHPDNEYDVLAVLLHEMGHCLGFDDLYVKQGEDPPQIPYPESIMNAYNPNWNPHSPSGPMRDINANDIEALKTLYATSVTCPNQGLQWGKNLPMDITWLHDAGGDMTKMSDEMVAICRDYVYNPNTSQKWQILQEVENTNHYYWEYVSGITSNDCRIMVRSITHPQIYDLCDVDFSIVDPVIHIESPGGGGFIRNVGDFQRISWTAQGIRGNMRVFFNESYPNENTWVAISDEIEPFDNPAIWYYFDWTVEATNPPSETCNFKVEACDGPAVAFDVLDSDFTVWPAASIHVEEPNGGPGYSWDAGDEMYIEWTSSYLDDNVNVYLVRDYGTPNEVLYFIDNGPANGNITYEVGHFFESDNYRIKVRSWSDYDVYDVSDQPFTITNEPDPVPLYLDNFEQGFNYSAYTCWDDDASYGDDYWGGCWCVPYVNGLGGAFCSTFGSLSTGCDRYDNGMNAWIKPNQDIVIQGYYDVEFHCNVYCSVSGPDDVFHLWLSWNDGYLDCNLTDVGWQHVAVNIPADRDWLRFEFQFETEEIDNPLILGAIGAYIDDIEVYGYATPEDGGEEKGDVSSLDTEHETDVMDVPLPTDFSLSQNIPNPFNPVTTIRFDLPEARDVKLQVYNMQGVKVAELVDGWCEAGYREVQFDGSKYASGIYIYRIQAGDFIQSRKMLLLK